MKLILMKSYTLMSILIWYKVILLKTIIRDVEKF